MKKIVLIVAVLTLAVPALAEVKITCGTQPWKALGDNTWCANQPWSNVDANLIIVDYNATSEANNVRAFALDITLTDNYPPAGTPNAVITSVEGFKVGESNSTSKGYGIFMGSIVIDGAGNVTDWNTPVAPAGEPEAAGPLGSNSITVELGSLYVGANSPAKSGTLFKFRVNNKACTVTITENTRRGGVVMENPDQVVGVNTPAAYVLCPGDICGAGYGARDGFVNFWDFWRLSANYNKTPPTDPRTSLCGAGYSTPDGTCNFWDFWKLSPNYGNPVGTDWR